MRYLKVGVDDVRILDNCDIVIRNFKTAIETLPLIEEKIETLFLDHDLGLEETGYDLLVWMSRKGFDIPKIELITANPIGRERMKMCLVRDMGYREIEFNTFYLSGKNG